MSASERRFYLGLGALAALALVLRSHGLEARGLWEDEISVLLETASGKRVSLDGPLVHLVHGIAVRLFGAPKLLALHAPGLFASSLAAVGVGLLARRFTATRGALLAAGLYALSPLANHYGQEIRPYSLMLLFTPLLFLTFLRLYLDGERRAWPAFAAVAALGLATHLMTAVLIAALIAFAGFDTLVLQRGSRRRLLAVVFGAALASPAALWVLDRRVEEVMMPGGALGLTSFLATVTVAFGPVHEYWPRLGLPAHVALKVGAAGVVLAFASAGAAAILRQPGRRRPAGAIATSAVALFFCVYYNLGEKGGWTWLRYVAPLLIPYLVLAAAGCADLAARARRPATGAALSGLLVGCFVGGLWLQLARPPRTVGAQYVAWARDIEAHAAELDGVLILPRRVGAREIVDLRALNLYTYFRQDSLPCSVISKDGVLATRVKVGEVPGLTWADVAEATELEPGRYAIFGLRRFDSYSFGGCEGLSRFFPGWSWTSARKVVNPLTEAAICEARRS